jgi:hypothetical protein
VATITHPRTAFGYPFTVEAPTSELAGVLDRWFRALPAATGERPHRYVLLGSGGSAELHLDGTMLHRATPAGAVGHLLWHLNRMAIAHAGAGIVLHAGGAVVDGVPVLVPAPMESGKSTLVAGLLRAGAAYLSDEAVAVDDTGALHPYPKALSLDPGSWPLFPELTPQPGRASAEWLPAQWQVPPGDLGADVVASPVPLGLVVLRRHEPGAATSSVRLSGGEALVALAGCVFPTQRPAPEILKLLARCLGEAPVYRVVGEDLDEAVAAVHAAVRSDVPSSPVGGEPAPALPVPDVLPSPEVPPSTVVPRVAEGVTPIEVQGDLVLHLASDGELLRCNPVGAAVWEAIDGRTTLTELGAAVGGGSAAARVTAFVVDLAARGALRLDPV